MVDVTPGQLSDRGERRDAAETRVARELHARLVAAAVFERSDGAYARRIALLVPLWLAATAALFVLPLWACAIACPLSGLLAVQLGMLGHDAGHGHIHRDRRINDLWGHVGMTLVCGQSYGYWRWRHDQHHRHPHEEGRDPDMQYDVVLSVDPRSALAKRGLGGWLRPFQAYYFWPIGAVYVWALRWDSLVVVWRGQGRTRWERALLPAHYALWLGVPALCVSPGAAVAVYVAVSTVLSLLLVALFAPNHIGMATVGPDARGGWLERRVAVTRNIANPPWLDWFFGGLNAHIEHHLFPRIAVPRLRAARAITRAVCREHGLPYREQTFFAAHRQVLGFLGEMARVSTASAGRGSYSLACGTCPSRAERGST